MTQLAPMILSKPLFIIVWMYQEMMRWLRRLLNGFVVGLGRSFGSNIEATDEICFDFVEMMTFLILMKPSCKFNPA
jgi:hypothetical protein